MFLPSKSARKAVRLANASVIFELSQLFGLLVSKWIMAGEGIADVKTTPKQPRPISQWSRQFRTDFTRVGAQVQALKLRTDLARWEGSIRGAWAVGHYLELNTLETEMLLYLAQVCIPPVLCIFASLKPSLNLNS